MYIYIYQSIKHQDRNRKKICNLIDISLHFFALCVCVFDIPTCTLNRLRSPGKKKTVRYGTRPGECHAEGALLPERLVREENAGADAERQR